MFLLVSGRHVGVPQTGSNMQTFYSDDKFGLLIAMSGPWGEAMHGSGNPPCEHHRWSPAGNLAEYQRLGQPELQHIRYLRLLIQHSGLTARIIKYRY